MCHIMQVITKYKKIVFLTVSLATSKFIKSNVLSFCVSLSLNSTFC